MRKRTREELKKALDQYIKENYREEEQIENDNLLSEEKISESDTENGVTKGSEEGETKKKSLSLDDLVRSVGQSFHEMLFYRIGFSGMTDVEVYKRANIDRKLFSKIRTNPAYHPSKQTVLALAVALKLSMEDTEDLLARAEYALSPANKGDVIVRYFIEQRIYDIMVINDVLDEYGQPILS